MRTKKMIWEINIAPLTDVFLVLLIIFMTTTPFLLPPTLKIHLPKAATSKEEAKRAVIISITEDASIYVGDKRIKDLKELEKELKGKLKEVEEKIVVIKGDKRVPLGVAVGVMDKACSAGAARIALATKLLK
jgi:biopolymer transport protein ExbD